MGRKKQNQETGIKLVGVELEGAWKNRTPPIGYQHDGSVSAVGALVGEVASSPLPLTDLLAWVLSPGIYPDFINDSCGLHIHVSFHNSYEYSLVATQDFFKAFLKRITQFGMEENIEKENIFWKRLSGKNVFCKNEFVPEKQYMARNKGQARYTMLNYCYSLHGTLENRLFPMFRKKSVACRAIFSYCQFINEYLQTRSLDPDIKLTVMPKASREGQEEGVPF